mgnify:CR=1 FL=1
MKSRFFIYFLMVFFSGFFSNVSWGQDGKQTSVPKVILDADLDSDVDDAGALAMLLNLHKAGTIELIGVIVPATIRSPRCVPQQSINFMDCLISRSGS